MWGGLCSSVTPTVRSSMGGKVPSREKLREKREGQTKGSMKKARACRTIAPSSADFEGRIFGKHGAAGVGGRGKFGRVQGGGRPGASQIGGALDGASGKMRKAHVASSRRNDPPKGVFLQPPRLERRKVVERKSEYRYRMQLP